MNLQEELNLPFPLRPYQEEGVKFLTTNNSALLGDDMGLGKTVQTIVALRKIYEKKGIFRCLIVVPNPLVTNWINEFSIWFSEVKILKTSGNLENRNFYLEESKGFQIITYEQIRNSFLVNHKIPNFDLVIFDEAQRIKNDASSTHMAASFINKNKAWMLTGTPLENNADDIVNIFNVLERGVVVKGSSNLEIKKAITPYLLRRKRQEILKDLPDLIEEDVYIDMSIEQRMEYDSIFEKRYSLNKSDSGSILSLITELKLACNFSPVSKTSAKLDYLKTILEEKYENKEKVIIFSQYVKTLKEIRKKLNFDFHFYHGGLGAQEKDDVLDKFKKDDSKPSNLLMSLKAGGVGLNLQEASTVILFDRWWNPALEQQAIARAHRMGNKSKVYAIKFITPDSIEDRIIDLLHQKEALFDEIVEGAAQESNKKNLLELLDLQEDE